MLICSCNNGMYNGSLLLLNREIENKEVVELVQMLTVLMRIDIMLEEIPVMKANVEDFATVYNLMNEEGNIMMNGGIWKARAMETIKQIFMTIMQASKIIETYETHQSVLEKFIEENKWIEKQEYVKVGWVETFDRNVKIQVRMTKRTSDFIQQRLEIFKTKVHILKKCKKEHNLGKSNLLELYRRHSLVLEVDRNESFNKTPKLRAQHCLI